MSRKIHTGRKTRIIATLGPATQSPGMIERLLQAGVDVFRLNMSHGSHREHAESIRQIRRLASKMRIHAAIFCDLCGPKIRVGTLAGGAMELKARSVVVVTTRRVTGRHGVIPSQYGALHKDVKPGDRILLDDGKLELKVLSVKGRDIECRVIYGGVLTDRKGINLPDSRVSAPSLTDTDRRDARFALEQGVDLLALSFVRSAEDILALKRYLRRHGGELPVIAKIEKPQALEAIDGILQEAHGIMIARGDLGIEIDPARLPMVQKELIDRARVACKPVIVATQMMESMIDSSRPTRAEVGDVSNAAMLGADAVMLSGETSVGRYPLQAVRYMNAILREAEQWRQRSPRCGDDLDMRVAESPRRALANAAMGIARDLRLLALLVPTRSGTTAMVVSAFRPSAPVIGVCPDARTARVLTLNWGVIPMQLKPAEIADWQRMSRIVARRLGLSLSDRSLAVLSGFGKSGQKDQPVLKILRF